MELELLMVLLVGSLAVTALSRARGWPGPLVVTGSALALSFIPGVPTFEIDAEFILFLVLPPLLYSAALNVSYQDFSNSLRQIRRLGFGLVLVTAVAVGFVLHWVFPTVPLPAALLIGAIVAPPDAVSAAAIGTKLGLPRKVMAVVSGESLINDAAALTLFKVFLALTLGSALSFWDGLGMFALAVVIGILVGLAFGVVVHFIRVKLSDPVVETVLALLVPFAAYLGAEHLHGSGVLAVVAAGLLLGYYSPEASYETRLHEQPVWASIDVLLEGFVFALIGLQLRSVLLEVSQFDSGLTRVMTMSVITLLLCVLIRPLFVFVTYYRNHFGFLSFRWSRSEPRMSWQELTVLSWVGMRGVVTLAAAAAVPTLELKIFGIPGRDVIFIVAFNVTVGTLLMQGLTLPWVIRRLEAHDPQQVLRDRQAELRLYRKTMMSALHYLERERGRWARKWGRDTADEVVDRIKHRLLTEQEMYEQMDISLDRVESPDGEFLVFDTSRKPVTRHEVVHKIRRRVLKLRREALMKERRRGTLDEEVMREILRELDAEELSLDTSLTSRMRS